MKKSKTFIKKAFTLVELVVVVAVIAILSGISVAAYVGLTERTNKAADEDVVSQLNVALAAEEARGNKNATCYDAIQDAIEIGIDVTTTKPNTANAYYVWDQENDRFALITDDEVIAQDSTRELTTVDYKIWTFGLNSKADCSWYFTGETALTEEISLTKAGFDVGEATGFKTISYTNTTGVAKDNVIIRTNEFATKVKVDASTDTVSHYGYSGLTYVTAIAEDTYIENGTVGRIEVTAGHVKANSLSTIYQVQSPLTTVTSTAKVYSKDGTTISLCTKSTICSDTLKACDCNHSDTIEVFDQSTIYEVCKKCGYTLITTETGEKYTVVDSNGDNVITPRATYDSSTLDNKNLDNGEVSVDDATVKEDASTVIEEPEEECDHNWVSVQTTAPTCHSKGLTTTTCSKCGGQYTTLIKELAHTFTYTSNSDGTHKVSCSSSGCTYTNTEACDTSGTNGACSKCGYK